MKIKKKTLPVDTQSEHVFTDTIHTNIQEDKSGRFSISRAESSSNAETNVTSVITDANSTVEGSSNAIANARANVENRISSDTNQIKLRKPLVP